MFSFIRRLLAKQKRIAELEARVRSLAIKLDVADDKLMWVYMKQQDTASTADDWKARVEFLERRIVSDWENGLVSLETLQDSQKEALSLN